jgi:hypothetical protein
LLARLFRPLLRSRPTPRRRTRSVTTGIDYRINGAIVAGNVVITKNTVVTATPKVGYTLTPDTVDRFGIVY